MMKGIGRMTYVLLISTFILLPMFFGVTARAVAAKEVVIGVVAGLSGPASEAFGNIAKGVKVGADWINEGGGITIKGEKHLLKLIVADAQGSMEGTVAAANKLVFGDKVKFIVGAAPAAPFVAAYAKVVEDNKVFRMCVVGLGTSIDLNSRQTYTFGDMPSSRAYGVGYDALVQLYPKAKTIAVIGPEDPATYEDMENHKKLAAAHGLSIVGLETHQYGAIDFYPVWTKLLAAKPPDIVVNSSTIPQWAGSILKQGRELGWKGIFMSPTCKVDPHPIRRIAGNLATDVISVGYDLKNPSTMTPEMKDMARRVKRTLGVDLLNDHLTGITALWLLAQAIENAQSLDPTVVRDSFEKKMTFKTVYGPGKVGGKKAYGLNHVVFQPVQVMRIMDGNIQHVRWVMPPVE